MLQLDLPSVYQIFLLGVLTFSHRSRDFSTGLRFQGFRKAKGGSVPFFFRVWGAWA